ncbi:hypothetical protein C1645_820881 [Glomus cerebriforme]|uniref:Uncharacterized protein n=1 Tax=Glomus cerebriforme TaxID=658196 RepID=A0A397T378_9GLOM|nr:hypothetical protein C1645_820881 [Glomus cerebriforme]
MSISNLNSRCNDVHPPLGIPPKKGKDPSYRYKQINDDDISVTSSFKLIDCNANNNNNNITRLARPRDNSPDDMVSPILIPTEDHVLTLMQDIVPLNPINISSTTNKDNSDPPPNLATIILPTSLVLMDTSSSNDSLIKKANFKKKKKSKQDPEARYPPMLMTLTKDNDLPISIPQEILNITFNEIVNKLIDMIIDQLDSTHLSSTLYNPTTDQLSTRYLAPLSSTGVLDKSHSFTASQNSSSQVDSSIHPLSFDTRIAIQRAQVAIKKDPCIKNIKAIKHKREYLKSIKAEESSSNQSQHALSSR